MLLVPKQGDNETRRFSAVTNVCPTFMMMLLLTPLLGKFLKE